MKKKKVDPVIHPGNFEVAAGQNPPLLDVAPAVVRNEFPIDHPSDELLAPVFFREFSEIDGDGIGRGTVDGVFESLRSRQRSPEERFEITGDQNIISAVESGGPVNVKGLPDPILFDLLRIGASEDLPKRNQGIPKLLHADPCIAHQEGTLAGGPPKKLETFPDRPIQRLYVHVVGKPGELIIGDADERRNRFRPRGQPNGRLRNARSRG